MTERAPTAPRPARTAGHATLAPRAGVSEGCVVEASPPRRRPRVLLANLGPMAQVGMRRLLSEDGIEVVGEQLQAASIGLEVARLQPDIVVLDLDKVDSQQLSEHVRQACPQAKVVLWARTEDVMEVIDPGATRPRWVLSGVPEELLAELSTLQVTPPVEE